MHLEIEEFSRDLDLDIESMSLIKENAYCHIFKADVNGTPLIIKKYKGEDSRLVALEAEAIDYYHDIVSDDPDYIDSRTIKLNADENLIAISYVEGESFASYLYKGFRDSKIRSQSICFMNILGSFQHRLFDMTRKTGEETSPFIFEYMDYCSNELARLPLLGSILFRKCPEEGAVLSDELQRSGVTPSFIHGDFVFLNMHVSGRRLGLIDFANTNHRSHVLNDVYNLRIALDNMILPRSFKIALWESFSEGLNLPTFPEIVHRFYYEFHRRRWLMVKIKAHKPRDWLQAVRGMLTFAKPFTSERVVR